VTQFAVAIYWNCFFKDQPTPDSAVVKSVFASLIAAVVHDAGHDGLSNVFHVNTKSVLAKSSFNISPLEHHHFSVFTYVLGINGCNVFENWSPEMRDLARNIIFNTVLSTDMKNHGSVERELLGKDKACVAPDIVELLMLFHGGGRKSEIEELQERFDDQKGRVAIVRNDSFCSHSSFSSRTTSNSDEVPTGPINVLYDLIKLSRLIVHTADISNCVRPFHISRKYAMLLYQEFAIQVAREKKLGLKVQPFMDPQTRQALASGEAQFIKFIAKPYMAAFARAIPGCQCLIATLNANIANWERESYDSELAAAADAAASEETDQPTTF